MTTLITVVITAGVGQDVEQLFSLANGASQLEPIHKATNTLIVTVMMTVKNAGSVVALVQFFNFSIIYHLATSLFHLQ